MLRIKPAALVAACILVTSCDTSVSVSDELTAAQSAAIDKVVTDQMAARKIPGLALAVVHNSRVVKRITAGLAQLAPAVDVSDTTPFRLASTTKPFTSVAVLSLVKDGKLKLNDSIGSYLDSLPAPWRTVTIRQLLSHTSGLPDIALQPGRFELIASTWEVAFPMIRDARLQFPAGTRWAYTQTNYVLLAKIIEKVTGRSYQEFLAERLFQPFGMTQSFFPDSTRSCATNYEPGADGTNTVRNLEFPHYVHAAGGLCTSLRDLVKWTQALDSGRVLTTALLDESWTPIRTDDGAKNQYGLGWLVNSNKPRYVGHSGGNATAYRRYIDDNLTIILLHNGTTDPDAIVDAIASVVLNSTATDPRDRLWDGAIAGDSLQVENAIKEGADINALDTRRSGSGRRALNWAAWHNHPSIVRLLIARGADLNAANKTGYTPLHHAAEAGSVEAADVLLKAGANTTLKNRAGATAAEVALANSRLELAAKIKAAVH